MNNVTLTSSRTGVMCPITFIRGATLLHRNSVPFDEIQTYLRQLTYAQRRRILGFKTRLRVFAQNPGLCQDISRSGSLRIPAFGCALCGPFNNLRLIRLPPARTLWVCTIIFISTSTVSTDFIKTRGRGFVNGLNCFFIKMRNASVFRLGCYKNYT